MAFHPNFASNGHVFVFYVGLEHPEHCSPHISLALSVLTVDRRWIPSSEQILLSIPQDTTAHKGGAIAFGPDGYLYISIGNDTIKNAQNTNQFYGTMVRIDVDNGDPYAIPPTNPFAAGGGRPELYAWGLRNPWRWSFDRVRVTCGLAMLGYVLGGDKPDRPGGNYGWRFREGSHCTRPDSPTCQTSGLIDPVFEYPHGQGGPTGVIGGYVYRGTAIPACRVSISMATSASP